MKVTGNNIPEAVHIERYLPKAGYVEVRLTENAVQLEENLWQYDEYVLQIPQRENLAEEIEANLTDWLITGRTLEVNENASEMADRKATMDVLGVATPAQAEAKHNAMVNAGAMLTDAQALEVIDLYDEWNGNKVQVYDGTDKEHPQTRVQRLGDLYKCNISHVTQPDWPPELTPNMWVRIDVAHAGTIDDPIPAARGMEYEEGKYYLDPEDGKVYLCTRGETLQYLPHELVGHYFEEVTE